MAILKATPLVNAIIARSQSLPELIASLPPSMATQLESKPLLASKTPIGTLAATAVAWVSTRYAFGWDPTTCSLVAGVALLAASYGLRAVTRQPVSGWFAGPPEPAPPPVAPVIVPPSLNQ